MNRRLALALATLCALVPAQVNDAPTHFVWALDSGDQTAPTPIIRVYTPSGREAFTVDLDSPMIGTGPARALAFDRLGNAYVCRGDLVHQLDRMGAQTFITFSPPTGSTKAQDVVETPQGDIMVSWGANAAASAITTYDTAGVMLSNFTDPALDHPRRITSGADPSSTIIYVANRGAQEILAFDPSAVPPTLTVTTDLTTENIGPVGLCYDNANDGLWVVSSYGQANEIGCIDLSSNTYATAFSYPPTVPTSAPGLLSPAGATYDRFRRLYLAGRNNNGGTPGVYVFEANDLAMPPPPLPMLPPPPPTFLAYWPRVGPTPVNVIDVAPQPSEQATCAPMEAVPGGNQFILEMGAVNRVTFSNPATSGTPYAAAFSGEWSLNPCGSPFKQGIIEIGFLLPDVRGIPLKSDDFFWGSVAVNTPGPSFVPTPTDPVTMLPLYLNDLSLPPWNIDISGFIGDLDVNGFEDGYIDLTNFIDPGNANGTDGMKIELAWVTFDFSEPALFGYVSQPLCLVLRNPDASPVVAIPCL
jgi:hypothetical protein